MVRAGGTQVYAVASVEKSVPRWMSDQGRGWVTAEYSMLPRANRERSRRERGQIGGRTQEIQRLIGRSLRAVTDLSRMPNLTITLDCDVLLADGGTRCASITAAYVALHDALTWCKAEGLIEKSPLVDSVAAVSVGIVDGKAVLDLDYPEDSSAAVDANFVITGKGRLVEIQMTGEEATFDEGDLAELLALAKFGVRKLTAAQRDVLKAGR